jgi:hypothetical protein
VTDTDKPAFAAAMGRLCLALREKDPDAAQLRAYFDALRPLDVELVLMAAESLTRAPWFPKAGEWYAAAVAVEHQRTEDLRARLRKLPAPLCTACGDTSFFLNETTNRAEPCSCRSLRRLEILGRRPMPALPEAPPSDPGQDTRVLAMATSLAQSKGIR